ncbi:MAG: TetR/AcrR family transcriptional regulator [Cyanobacteria bacterium P01_H01_bin.15]
MTRGPSKQFDTEVALEQAMKLFWAYGYEATSLSELLKTMGIGKKSLYDTFGNKQSLFLKALDHYAHITVRDIRARLSADGSSLFNLKQLLRDWYEMNNQPDSCGCMFGTNIADFNMSDEVIAKTMRGYLQQLEDVLSAALVRAKAEGELKPESEPRNLARLILCSSQGMALIGRVMNNDPTLKGNLEALILLLDNS